MLSEFLSGIKKSKSCVNFSGMANILIVHSQNSGKSLRYNSCPRDKAVLSLTIVRNVILSMRMFTFTYILFMS